MEDNRFDSEGNYRNEDIIHSKRIKAGKRTYFFDVKATRGNDYYLTITESKKSNGKYVRHKIFLYKEDFNKFSSGLNEVIDHIKDELLPDYDYEKFDNREEGGTSDDDFNFDDDFDKDFNK